MFWQIHVFFKIVYDVLSNTSAHLLLHLKCQNLQWTKLFEKARTVANYIKIKIITIKTNQWHETVSNKCNAVDLIFLFKNGRSRFIEILSLISSKYLLFPCAKMLNSSKEVLLPHCKRWSRIELSLGGLIFLKVSGDIAICLLYLTFKCLPVSI